MGEGADGGNTAWDMAFSECMACTKQTSYHSFSNLTTAFALILMHGFRNLGQDTDVHRDY